MREGFVSARRDQDTRLYFSHSIIDGSPVHTHEQQTLVAVIFIHAAVTSTNCYLLTYLLHGAESFLRS